MKHICAWCKVELPEDDEEPRDGISHGMCLKCAAEWDKQLLDMEKQTDSERR